MVVFVGADHRGWQLKSHLVDWLRQQGYEVVDLGADTLDTDDDFVDYAVAVARQVRQQANHRGIVICGSGVGVDIAANKLAGIRCGLCCQTEQVRSARQDDNINLLALAADYLSLSQAEAMVEAFLSTPFADLPRFNRRLDKIKQLEDEA